MLSDEGGGRGLVTKGTLGGNYSSGCASGGTVGIDYTETALTYGHLNLQSLTSFCGQDWARGRLSINFSS